MNRVFFEKYNAVLEFCGGDLEEISKLELLKRIDLE